VEGAQLADVAVHAGDDVGDGLADGDEDAQQFLGAVAVKKWGKERVSEVDKTGLEAPIGALL